MANSAYHDAYRLQIFIMTNVMKQIFFGSLVVLVLLGILFVILKSWKMRGTNYRSIDALCTALEIKSVLWVFICLYVVSVVNTLSALWLAIYSPMQTFTFADGTTLNYSSGFGWHYFACVLLTHINLVAIAIIDKAYGVEKAHEDYRPKHAEKQRLVIEVQVPGQQRQEYVPFQKRNPNNPHEVVGYKFDPKNT